jgi:hypothetical protein
VLQIVYRNYIEPGTGKHLFWPEVTQEVSSLDSYKTINMVGDYQLFDILFELPDILP